jgi:hypothetical protein
VAAVGGLRLHIDVCHIVEDSGGVIRRAVVGDDERDTCGEWGDVIADLVDEASDAFGFVVCRHDDGEMGEGQEVPRRACAARVHARSSLVE